MSGDVSGNFATDLLVSLKSAVTLLKQRCFHLEKLKIMMKMIPAAIILCNNVALKCI